MVVVSEEGKSAITWFRPIHKFKQATLVEAIPLTGRTHQIRVHATHIGHPLAGDEKYGDRDFNRQMQRLGLRRLFLHSASLSFKLDDVSFGLCALLDPELKALLNKLL